MDDFSPLQDGDLFSAPNKYDELLSSFIGICKFLEFQANNRKNIVELENEMTFAETSRAITKTLSYMGNLNQACKEIATNTSLNRKNGLDKDEYIEMPYNIQSETVECLRDVYGSSVGYEKDTENKLLPESNREAAETFIRTVNINASVLESFQILQTIDR